MFKQDFYNIWKFGKSIPQVPDTGTRVLDNTRPFLCSSIVSFWITPAHSKECKYHFFKQYRYTKNVPVFANTGTFQCLGLEVYFFRKFDPLVDKKLHPSVKQARWAKYTGSMSEILVSGPCVSAPGSSQGNRKPLILEIPWSRMIWHVFLEPILELHLLSL